MSLHRESGLPYNVYRHYALQEAKERANVTLKRKATPASSSSAPKKQKTSTTTSNPGLSDLKNLPPDAKQLLQIIMKSDEKALRTSMARSIISASSSPSDLAAYKKLFGLLVTAAQNPLHCVRCHSSYLQAENNSSACRIPHQEPDYLGDDASVDYPCDEDEDEDEEGDNPMYKFPCCGERIRERDLDYGGEVWCVEEMHTTDPNKVDYFVNAKRGSKKKVEYGLDYYSRYKSKNSNVLTCQEKKCSKM